MIVIITRSATNKQALEVQYYGSLDQ